LEKIRLLAVIDHLGGGGAEKQFLELVTRLEDKGFDVRVFLAEGGGIRISSAKEKGIPVLSWGKDALSPSYSGRRTPSSLRALIKVMREFRPQVTLGWLSYSITLTALASFMADAGGLVFSERSSLEYMFKNEVRLGALKKHILRFAFKKARFVVTNTTSVADEFIQENYCHRSAIKVIHNGVDLPLYDALPSKSVLRERLGLASERTYGVFVGKYEERKGLRSLISALYDMGDGKPEMLAIGSGSMEQELKNSGVLQVLGYRENAIDYIKAADFLVLPSRYEGLPNVILEAMAVGTPVIATEVHGIPELIQNDENGILVPPLNADTLREAILRLSGNKELRQQFSIESFRKIKDFSMEMMVSKFVETFKEAASNRT